MPHIRQLNVNGHVFLFLPGAFAYIEVGNDLFVCEGICGEVMSICCFFTKINREDAND